MSAQPTLYSVVVWALFDSMYMVITKDIQSKAFYMSDSKFATNAWLFDGAQFNKQIWLRATADDNWYSKHLNAMKSVCLNVYSETT